MLSSRLIAMGLVAGVASGFVYGASDVAQADAQRKKPLQRCDQLSDQAEIECLRKARERIVEARQKRQTAAKRAPAAAPRAKRDAPEPSVKK